MREEQGGRGEDGWRRGKSKVAEVGWLANRKSGMAEVGMAGKEGRAEW
ncbi:hypothetical protein E2C01_093290 [Portunus trituberculatus]|uniref:Uncharacterized protein n=1 Tax=Portunus trituberculatus TaxID=210409 RepID=A0A5B7K041_PORTR|nr:hypothetical protein [Portunus trituberculatus]